MRRLGRTGLGLADGMRLGLRGCSLPFDPISGLGSFGPFHRLLGGYPDVIDRRSEEHTSELQSHLNLVCRLLLEKKKYSHRGFFGTRCNQTQAPYIVHTHTAANQSHLTTM